MACKSPPTELRIETCALFPSCFAIIVFSALLGPLLPLNYLCCFPFCSFCSHTTYARMYPWVRYVQYRSRQCRRPSVRPRSLSDHRRPHVFPFFLVLLPIYRLFSCTVVLNSTYIFSLCPDLVLASSFWLCPSLPSSAFLPPTITRPSLGHLSLSLLSLSSIAAPGRGQVLSWGPSQARPGQERTELTLCSSHREQRGHHLSLGSGSR